MGQVRRTFVQSRNRTFVREITLSWVPAFRKRSGVGASEKSGPARMKVLMDDPASEAHVEQLLRQSRPEPDPEFLASLERRLFPRRVGEPRRGRRPFLVGAAATAAMASVALVAGLIGAGPLALDGQSSSQAGDHCRFVLVKRSERVPVVVTTRNGDQKLRFRPRTVERRVKRCS